MSNASSTEVMITRHVPVKVDQYRKNALADKQAMARGEEIRITNHMKNVTDSLKAQIKEHQHAQTVAAEAIVAGFEMVDVACRVEIDVPTCTYRVIREDSHEPIEERTATVDEMKRARKTLEVVR